MDRSRQRGAWIALMVALLWAVVGCGAEESASYDRDGSVQAVEQGKQALVELLNGQPDTVPYYELTEIGVVFEQAGELDPTYDEARFWSALFALPNFLERDDTRAFLARLGWQSLKGSAAGAGDGEFEDFAERLGQTLGVASSSVTGGTTGGEDPPLHDFGLPNDPDDSQDPHPCIDPTGANPDCDPDATGWQPTPVILFGTDSYVTITFQELYDFLTGSLGNAVHEAVARLKAIGSDFSTSITATLIGSQEDPVTITFDAFEVKLLQALYGALDVVTSLPTLWTYGDVDTFWSQNSTRDDTGAFIPKGGKQVVDDISTDDLTAYFKTGNDGTAGTGDEPLRSNPAGVARLKQALADLLEAAQSVLARLATGDALEGHLLTPALVFSSYDDQPRVVAYGAQALASMVGESRGALNGPQVVTAYLPVATIQDFGVCDPVAGSTTDTAPMNSVPSWTETVLDLANVLTDVDLSTADKAEAAVQGTEPFTDHYFRFQLDAPANVSMYTTSADGAMDTTGAVAYQDGLRSANLLGWDSDEDSGTGRHFGLSIAAAHMDGALLPLPSVEVPLVLYVRVTSVTGGDFTLHVQRQPAEGGWPAGEPIFLKGGGRNFLARTYSYGSLRVNAGAALTVASELFDRSQRETLAYSPDDLNTPDVVDPSWSLDFTAGQVRGSILEVLPDASFSGELDPATTGDTVGIEPLAFLTDVDPGGDLGSAQPVAVEAFDTLSFCAYPQDLGTFSPIAGGRTALGFW
jgi:hypothetical protein